LLIQENIQAIYSFETPENIRFNRIWKKDVAGIFKANEQLLQQLFAKMQKKHKYLSIEQTYKMVEKVDKYEAA
jgi:hypothetical protein